MREESVSRYPWPAFFFRPPGDSRKSIQEKEIYGKKGRNQLSFLIKILDQPARRKEREGGNATGRRPRWTEMEVEAKEKRLCSVSTPSLSGGGSSLCTTGAHRNGLAIYLSGNDNERIHFVSASRIWRVNSETGATRETRASIHHWHNRHLIFDRRCSQRLSGPATSGCYHCPGLSNSKTIEIPRLSEKQYK